MQGGFLGVDVFFVISGFLMYGALMRMRIDSFRIAREFWVRRIRRLFPAAATVILVTFLAARALLPDTRWVGVAREAIASLFFSVNWVFVSASVDYLQAENRPSAFQHYWSLSVEEQYYIILPVGLIAAAAIARKAGSSIETMGKLVVSGLFIASFAYSIYLTNRDAAEAYFHTGTRLWELALGGIVSAWQPALNAFVNRAPVVTRIFSYTMIGSSFWIINGSMPIPGYTALLPVFGAGLFIAQSSQAHPFRRIEENRAVQFIGEQSYSIYLVHWPLLILAAEASNFFTEPLGITFLLIATLVLAWTMKKFIEDPIRYGSAFKPTHRLVALTAATTVIIAGLAATQIVLVRIQEQTAFANRVTISSADQQLETQCFGAQAMVNSGCPDTFASLSDLKPDPLIAKDDLPIAYEGNCITYRPFTEYLQCEYGSGSRTIAVVGNSHGIQWLEPIIYAAEQNDAKVVTLFASQCNASDMYLEFGNDQYTDACHKYGEWVQRQVSGLGVDLAILSQRQSVPVQGYSLADSSAPAVEGYTTYLTRMIANARILVVKDPVNPPPEYGLVPDCVEMRFPDLASCEWSQHHEYWQDPQWVAAKAIGGPKVSLLSLDNYMCRDGYCLAVIGGVVVYRDNTHVTNTFALSLAPQFAAAVAAALEGAQ